MCTEKFSWYVCCQTLDTMLIKDWLPDTLFRVTLNAYWYYYNIKQYIAFIPEMKVFWAASDHWNQDTSLPVWIYVCCSLFCKLFFFFWNDVTVKLKTYKMYEIVHCKMKSDSYYFCICEYLTFADVHIFYFYLFEMERNHSRKKKYCTVFQYITF